MIFVLFHGMTNGVMASSEPSTGFSTEFLVNMDREISGILDAYLEAVPECPVRIDTPLRLWVLDLSWLRAEAVLEEAEAMGVQGISDTLRTVWNEYLSASRNCFRVLSEIQRIYHQPSLPPESLSIELENELLQADSVWRIAEERLFELIAENEVL
ncbi:MAG: hypothetical protein GF388_04465 [Candidatus Aegiribacteria sp.]|nr:hypothetical protein [Candidatus Aegiribacteria sp.]MBD3294489.1 hypothetical protein [Candidatus Fermentibacteria bacterium]